MKADLLLGQKLVFVDDPVTNASILGVILVGSDGQPMVLNDEGHLVTIHSEHLSVHLGNTYQASYMVPHGSELANDAALDVLFVAETKAPHLDWILSSGGDFEISMYEGTTGTGGTPISIHNLNRNSSNTTSVTVVHTPTVSAVGELQEERFIPGGAGPQASGGTARRNTEWILKPNTKYLFRAINRSGAAQMASIVLQWYYEE